MSRIHYGALTILAVGLLVSDVVADGHKGPVLSDTTTPVTLNAEGRPVVGGKFGLEIKPTRKGVLLAIRIPCQDGGPPKVRYLSYPTERGAPAAVRAVAEPGPGCYWTQTCCSSHRKFGSFFDRFQYTVKEGPFQSCELWQNEEKRLVLDEEKLIGDSKLFFGRTIEYDDLDDGK